jgi:hypothetical protein
MYKIEMEEFSCQEEIFQKKQNFLDIAEKWRNEKITPEAFDYMWQKFGKKIKLNLADGELNMTNHEVNNILSDAFYDIFCEMFIFQGDKEIIK